MSEARIYDIYIDEFRTVTQGDVDKLMAIATSYGLLMEAFRDAEKRHAEMYTKPPIA